MKTQFAKGLSLIAGLGLFTVSSTTSAEEPGRQGVVETVTMPSQDATSLIVQAGRYAQKRATHPAVRQLATIVVSEHQAFRDKLQREGGTLEVLSDPELERRFQDEWSRLRNVAGADTDKAFVQMVARVQKAHLEAIRHAKPKPSPLIEEYTRMAKRHLQLAELASRKVHVALSGPVGVQAPARKNGHAPQPVRQQANGQPSTASKNDGEFLGLPTSKNDGTILGLFPAPSRTVKAGSNERYIARELVDGEVDPGVDNVFEADRRAVGLPAGQESGGAQNQPPLEADGSSAQSPPPGTPKDQRDR